MPPIPDQQLEERILMAARRLWREHGEKGLTLRGVARAAGTTTPTVYKRFRNKDAIQLALAIHVRSELFEEMFKSSRVEEIYRRYLAHAEAHPHEHELLRLSWSQLFSPGRPRLGRVWTLGQMAARFGGQPEDYEQLFDALVPALPRHRDSDYRRRRHGNQQGDARNLHQNLRPHDRKRWSLPFLTRVGGGRKLALDFGVGFWVAQRFTAAINYIHLSAGFSR